MCRVVVAHAVFVKLAVGQMHTAETPMAAASPHWLVSTGGLLANARDAACASRSWLF